MKTVIIKYSVNALTHGSAARFGSGAGNLLSRRVHAPALAEAGVTLQGFVRAVAVAGGHVLTERRTRAEGGRGRGQRRGSVSLTRRLLAA